MVNFKNFSSTNRSEVDRIVCEELTSQLCENYVLIGEDDTCLPDLYLKYADAIDNFEIRNSDIIVASYPKTGSTWTQEMVWLITNDLNFAAATVDIGARFPLLELCTLLDWEKADQLYNQAAQDDSLKFLEFIEDMANPRFIKSHLSFPLLPRQIRDGLKSPKIIYVTRDPKDTCVSYFHYGKLFHGWNTTLENFCKVFLSRRAMYGCFWKHVLGYWKQRNNQNILYLSFEEMKLDLVSVIRKVAEFLDKKLTDEQIRLLSNHLSFESMRKNRAVNHELVVEIKKKQNPHLQDGTFMRSGTVGKYKEEMTPETVDAFDSWTRENIGGTEFNNCFKCNVA